VRFNKDDIRKELNANIEKFDKELEALVIQMERSNVEKAMIDDKEYIIVDNTHLQYKD
jgi:hypothetical protein